MSLALSPSELAQAGTLPLIARGETVALVDQRKLPSQLAYFDVKDCQTMCYAIKDMVVRGAPALGVAAGFGLALAAQQAARESDSISDFWQQLAAAKSELQKTRPTAVNIYWSTEKLYTLAEKLTADGSKPTPADTALRLWQEAEALLYEHIRVNRCLSDFGASLIKDGSNVLTHCNAGSLATCGWGTALGVIRSAHFAGAKTHVYVDETRPRNQGSKLTIWELEQDGIPATLIPDSLAGYLMSRGAIDLVITGADRIATNGDTANKVGTYSIAQLAKVHEIPFYVAAPLSTVDPSLNDASGILIEERSTEELTTCGGMLLTTPHAKALNLSFDITPGALIAGIITEAGILRPPYQSSIPQAVNASLNIRLDINRTR